MIEFLSQWDTEVLVIYVAFTSLALSALGIWANRTNRPNRRHRFERELGDEE